MLKLSLVGLVTSLVVNVASIFGFDIPLVVLVLHVGIFVVLFPTMHSIRRRMGASAPPPGVPSYKHALDLAQRVAATEVAGLSPRAKLGLGVLGLYGFCFGAISMLIGVSRYGLGRHAMTVESKLDMLRTFSGLWITAYALLVAASWSAARLDQAPGKRMMGPEYVIRQK